MCIERVLQLIKQRTFPVRRKHRVEFVIYLVNEGDDQDPEIEDEDEDVNGDLEFRIISRKLPRRNGSRPRFRVKIH